MGRGRGSNNILEGGSFQEKVLFGFIGDHFGDGE
jgi:hypothetical protein